LPNPPLPLLPPPATPGQPTKFEAIQFEFVDAGDRHGNFPRVSSIVLRGSKAP
jgi:hypothetical protein